VTGYQSAKGLDIFTYIKPILLLRVAMSIHSKNKKINNRRCFPVSAFALLGLLLTTTPVVAQTSPNIVVILVDDAGLMDFEPYGGEARMPSIQRLADQGVRFSNYRTSPLCAPSRAMLLTGVDNHLTGVATIPEVIPAEHIGKPGYSLALEPGVKTIADHLRAAGYRTYMTGKWHMGRRVQDLPVSHGFDRSFALDASGADNWEQKPYMAYYTSAPWYEDDQPATLPDDFYSSAFIVDKMIDYIDADNKIADKSAQPFLAYLAFQAIHIPIQAPREFTEHYDGVYDQGWHVLREQRWQKAKQLGLIQCRKGCAIGKS
jgi:arylsulfatase A-like enzyme